MATIQGVAITGAVVPTDTTDTYPVIDQKYGKDGLRNVRSIYARNIIPAQRRTAGMLVGVTIGGVTSYYKLLDRVWDNTNDDWEELIFGGGAVTNKFEKTSDGTTLVYTITHNLNEKNHIVQIIHESGDDIYTQIVRGLNTDVITLNMALPAGEKFTILVI